MGQMRGWRVSRARVTDCPRVPASSANRTLVREGLGGLWNAERVETVQRYGNATPGSVVRLDASEPGPIA